ncbi:Phosphoglycerate mutase-like protein AT74H [Glycine max]|nr:Phosphoglycerate mutase-like protein AT74H [Glycine max]
MAAPLTDGYNSTCPPTACTRSTFRELKRCFLKKRIIDVREESRVREQDLGNFQMEERMNIINEIRERYERFFYQ